MPVLQRFFDADFAKAVRVVFVEYVFLAQVIFVFRVVTWFLKGRIVGARCYFRSNNCNSATLDGDNNIYLRHGSKVVIVAVVDMEKIALTNWRRHDLF